MHNFLKHKPLQILLGVGMILIGISAVTIELLHPEEVHTDGIIIHLPTNKEKITKSEIDLQQYLNSEIADDTSITRAQITKVIVLLSGEEEKMDEDACFTDIENIPEAPYICYAAKQGWVNGYFSGKFKPEKTVTKAEVAIILSQLLGYTIPLTLTEDVYTDVTKDDWYAPYIYAMKQNNLLGSGDIFEPTHPATYTWLQTILNQIHSQI